jgi:protein-tyrosine-phosphatase
VSKYVLFVCAVNRCRSVVAEYYLREIIRQRKDRLAKEIRVSSAGVGLSPEDIQLLASHGKHWDSPVFGLPPYPYAVESMKRRQIDISGSRSKELNKAMVDKADLIIVFQDSQKSQICSLYPLSEEKVYTLQELVGYDGYLVNIDYSFPSTVPNAETKSLAMPDSLIEGTVTEIIHMIWWGINRIIDFVKRRS